MRRFPLIALGCLLALAACGQPAPSPPPPAQPSAPAPSTEARQTAIAALPAPYNEANYEAGRRVFAQCRACHTLDAGAGNRVGPNLHLVFGREIGTAPGFTYSPAALAGDFTWDAERLDQWLANPQGFLPGNRMAFVGVREPTQRRDVIAYLMVETAE